uniref:Uncharacterized protein n=1 Tax=Physcomitrium patens TaxID=3218 RepID=A0A7I4BAW2_PHYPA|nr:uncharacterized protein LOC112294147 isoform X2 [Physcomitrium patens]|eukprot:XP_024400119.1 uncharacterized protein LOC112294147 isoform X2 [Physcomitrella patens]
MRIRVSIFPGVKAGYRAFVSGWTRLALKFKRRVSAGDWDSPRPHSLFVFFSASSSGWSSVFGSMLLIDCVLRSLIVCCGRGWWLQKLLLSTDLLQCSDFCGVGDSGIRALVVYFLVVCGDFVRRMLYSGYRDPHWFFSKI